MKNIDIEVIESHGWELKELSQQLIYINNRVTNILQSLDENGVDDFYFRERLNHKLSLIEISTSLNAISDDLMEIGELLNVEIQMNMVYAPPEFMGSTKKSKNEKY